jgi:dTDP-4-dehydrorhamnose reductase
MHKVLLLGAEGLLGSNVSYSLTNRDEIDLIETSRNISSDLYFNYTIKSLNQLLKRTKPDFVINCTGLTSSSSSFLDMLKVNSFLPLHLAILGHSRRVKVIHIGSNAVFSGFRKSNSEKSVPFPLTRYGLSKLIGDLSSFHNLVIRTSFVGLSRYRQVNKGILEKLKALPSDSTFHIQENFTWNGLTTDSLSEFITSSLSIIPYPHGVIHVVADGKLTRLELIEALLIQLDRNDVTVKVSETKRIKNMSLDTEKSKLISKIWDASRYGTTPKILRLIQELQ